MNSSPPYIPILPFFSLEFISIPNNSLIASLLYNATDNNIMNINIIFQMFYELSEVTKKMYVLVLSPISAGNIKYSQLTCNVLDYPQKGNVQVARKKKRKKREKGKKKNKKG